MGTPRLATDAKQQVVWRWNEDAFGAKVSTDQEQHGHRNHDWDHGRSHDIEVNLRYPGQYYDAETGLFYNWNRYYDPSTGRYATSDPIGLSGGVNTFLYVVGNPLGHRDLKGLQISGLPIPMVPLGMGPGFGGNVAAGLPLGLGAIAAVGAIADWAMNNEGEERPPAGSKPIDQTPWSGDHQDIKRGVGAGPKDNVKIDPSDNVWVQNPDGTWTNYGDAGSYTGSGNPSGRRGKDRCKW
ncbi:MAG: hypothetical protein B7X44_10885 [Halothiobacillus sp. 15-55-196]|nr:MAG: hypothetical protein B7X44_10885 [Halothiobacillus sp. 15-55-196]